MKSKLTRRDLIKTIKMLTDAHVVAYQDLPCGTACCVRIKDMLAHNQAVAQGKNILMELENEF